VALAVVHQLRGVVDLLSVEFRLAPEFSPDSNLVAAFTPGRVARVCVVIR